MLMGGSGCGKTTFLNLVAGIESPDSGQVLLNGKSCMLGQFKMAYIFQYDALIPWMTVEQNLLLGLLGVGHDTSRHLEEMERLLQAFGLDGKKGAFPAELSGGQRQRIAVIQNLLARPSLILLDEPTTSLDLPTKLKVQREILKALSEMDKKPTVLMATHDMDEAILFADRILVFTGGEHNIAELDEISVPIPAEYRNPEMIAKHPSFLGVHECIIQHVNGRN